MATIMTRPFSLLQPSSYGTDFSRRSSSQRPFSLALPREPRARRRPSSGLGDAPHSATMGFELKNKLSDRVRRSSHSRPRTPDSEVTNRHPLVLVENVNHQGSPKRTNRFFSSTGLQSVKQKRSISGLFSNGDAPSISMALDIVSAPIVAMIHDRPASAPPVEKKRVSVVPEADAEMQNEQRAARFQPKNHFLMKHGMKHHPYPHRAPYMQAYDPVLLDNDRFTEVLLRRLNPNGSPTFHDYGLTPPLNVLDLGCGHGGWVVEAATAWKSFGTKVTGFDLVDVSSHSWEVNEASLDNITWVQGDFLNYQLPFADNSFDLVRMANLSLAIPQDSWFPVLSEVRRVLTPAGRLELIDDQILFPYDESPSLPTLSSHSQRSASSFDLDTDDDIINTNASSAFVDEPTYSDCPTHTLPKRPSPQEASAEWKAHAENSKGLETIFESMLMKKYGINPRPQDIIDVVLVHVFGRKHADQIKSMHLALAPVDQSESASMADRMSMIGPEVGGIIHLTNERNDKSMDIEEPQLETEDNHTKPEWRERLHPSGFKHDTISPKAAGVLGIGTSAWTESIGARTTSRFKIYPSTKWKGKWNESIRSRRASMESLHSAIPESISPKAAERLGIAPADRRSWGSQQSQSSQRSQTKRMDHPSGDQTNRENIIPAAISMNAPDRLGITPSLGSAQSPGFILWPSTFIPVEPLELEMHACKHMHLLLGCKAALSDFIQDIKGADGQAHISQDELNDLTWEYECFRRKRFKWPAEIPNSHLSITSQAITPKSAPVPLDTSSGHLSTGLGTDSTSFRRQSGFVHPKSSYTRQGNALTSSESSMPTYNRKDLTFVRVIRVYEAFNIGKPENE